MEQNDASGPLVDFYTAAGCSLCRTMREALDTAVQEVACIIRTHYIYRGDDGNFERYWDKIPVLCINGKEVFRYRAEASAIVTALKQAAQASVAD